ncbi:MAG: prepilin-type N-terminal cleavage/methylation domain-containing protein [Sedimentisphaerales bacterium]|nr:prepilin-type N-terminal cleavage/methylation domain-containing protein [Sedimentisphaerales bacterium]
MKYRVNRSGFTLVEMFVAMAIVVSIVSMVYGSYFATAKSAEVYKAMMTTSKSAAGVLQQMTRQIRCSYAETAEASPASVEKMLGKTQGIIQEPVNYFKGDFVAPTGEILHFVTTARFSRLDDFKDGLLDVVYRFDKSTRTLSISQRRFVERPTDQAEDRDFTAVIGSIESIELAFLDDRQWMDEWDFNQKKALPGAVRISIACEDESGRKCSYGAVAQVYCLNPGKQ